MALSLQSLRRGFQPKVRRRLSLAEAVKRLQSGEPEALPDLIRESQEMGYHLAISFLKDPHRAQDVLQEAYLIVHQKIHQLRDPSAFRTWFFRIVSNLCRKQLKSERATSLDSMVEQGFEPYQESMQDRVETRLCLARAMKKLKPHHRQALILREVEQLSYEEMAERLEVPLGTVRSRIANARRLLMAQLEEKDRSR